MKKILVLGVIAVLLSFGLILASCDGGGCPGDGECPKTWADKCKSASCASDLKEQSDKNPASMKCHC